MENTEKSQNSKMDIDNPNHASPSISNNLINSKSNQTGEINSNSQLKKGQFMLTPLEGLLLNKKMPRGFKFETEDNILKTFEAPKNKHKRLRHGGVFGDTQKRVKTIKNSVNESNNNNLNKEPSSINDKKIKKEKQKDTSLNINNNSEQYKIMKKCYSGFNKIKSNPNSNFFYVAKFPDSPSLSSIEKKIKNYEYKTVNDFCDDLRKLWNYQFKHYAKEPNIYQNICKMSLLSDQICKELLNDNLNENKNEEISNIKKRNEKIKKSINEVKENNQGDEINKNNRKQNMEEINHLGQLIRTLNKQQLKGIIPILSDKNESNNTKMFEFDLEQLSFEKFKKLEEYVLNCFNKNKNPTKIINKNIGTNKEINRNIKNNVEQEQKDKPNINNSNHHINNSNNNKNLNQKEKNLNEPFKNHEKKNNINNDYSPSQANKIKAKENKNEEIPKKDIEKIDEIKGNNLNEKNNKNNKPKSWEEINHLGQLIRTLNRQQLKGIIPILSDKNDNNNEKMFEFNLEQLSLEKFEKLEEYVLNCKNKNSNNNKNININIANKEINKNENKINKNVNNDLNINNNKNNNNNINNNEINKNLNIKEKNNMNNQKANNVEENPKKSFSDSDSMSSYSSLSN